MTDKEDVQKIADHLCKVLRTGLKDINGTANGNVRIAPVPLGFHMFCTFNGWSPSLHDILINDNRIMMHRDEKSGTPRAPDEVAEDGVEWIKNLLKYQSDRAVDAGSMGQDKPFEKTQIEHLEIEEAFMHLRNETPEKAREAIIEAIRRAHSSTNTYRGNHVIQASGVQVAESPRNGGWTRFIVPNIKIRASDGKRYATMRGFRIEIDSPPLPDIVVMSLPGRPLKDLVEIHPMLDERTIRKAEARTGRKSGIIVSIDLHIEPVTKAIGPNINQVT